MIQLILGTCRAEAETTEHFLLSYHFYYTQRSELFDKRDKVSLNFQTLNAKDKVLFLLYVVVIARHGAQYG